MTDTPKRAYSEGRLDDARRLLLEYYTRKQVRRLIQIDGHKVGGPDDITPPDSDGHCLTTGNDIGLYDIAGTSNLPVRVLIREAAEKEEVLQLLDKIRDWVERDYYSFCLASSGLEDHDIPL